MQMESKRTLPGRVKLVSVALLALSAVVGVWLHASKGASTEVQSLAVDQTSVQVHVHNAATHAEAKAFCKEEYGDALNHVSFVCDLDETSLDDVDETSVLVYAHNAATKEEAKQFCTEEYGGIFLNQVGFVCGVDETHYDVVLKLDDERNLHGSDGTNVGAVHLLNNYQISFDVKIYSSTAGWSQIFTLDAGEPKPNAFGRQPAVYLHGGTSKFLVVWGTLANGNGDMCVGQTTYEAPVGEYLHISLVNKPSGVEFYADYVLRCHKEGDFVGRNRDAIVWLTSGDWRAAYAAVKNFKIQTWN